MIYLRAFIPSFLYLIQKAMRAFIINILISSKSFEQVPRSIIVITDVMSTYIATIDNTVRQLDSAHIGIRIIRLVFSREIQRTYSAQREIFCPTKEVTRGMVMVLHLLSLSFASRGSSNLSSSSPTHLPARLCLRASSGERTRRPAT